MEIEIPRTVGRILNSLENAGFEAYVVGGCVRDSILGITPHDWDITTNATPVQVKTVFNRTIDTGIKHGTVSVLMNGDIYEITTYRIDGIYEDKRHPSRVDYTTDVKEDLKRRDFTINAMAYNPVTGLVDEFDGVSDLKKGIIRAVGNPIERFEEDALRMLRALRFAARFGFIVEDETYEAIKTLKDNLYMVSAERINQEFSKILISDHPEFIEAVEDSGLMQYICSGLDVSKAMNGLREIENSLPLRLVMVLKGYEGNEEKVREVLRNLKYDNNTIRRVSACLLHLYDELSTDRRELKHFLCEIGSDYAFDIMKCRLVLKVSQRDQEVLEMLKDIVESKEAYTLSMLPIGGKDIMELGVSQGKMVGDVLSMLLEKVIETPSLCNREILLELAKEGIHLEEEKKI